MRPAHDRWIDTFTKRWRQFRLSVTDVDARAATQRLNGTCRTQANLREFHNLRLTKLDVASSLTRTGAAACSCSTRTVLDEDGATAVRGTLIEWFG